MRQVINVNTDITMMNKNTVYMFNSLTTITVTYNYKMIYIYEYPYNFYLKQTILYRYFVSIKYHISIFIILTKNKSIL